MTMTRSIIITLLAIAIWISGFCSGRVSAATIDCNAAVANQASTPGVGHREICIDVNPTPWKKSSPYVTVESWFGSDEMGYYSMNDDTTIDKSRWRSGANWPDDVAGSLA